MKLTDGSKAEKTGFKIAKGPLSQNTEVVSMHRKMKVYLVFTVIIASMGFLLISGFDQDTMTYYTTVKELKAKGNDAYNNGYRVSGTVEMGSLKKSADQLVARFVINEEGETLQVEYRGIVPDTFKEGGDVLLEGRFRSDQVFYATNIMTKCASKYDPSQKTSDSAQQY